MQVKYGKLSDYKIKKIIDCFCSDIEAVKTAKLLLLNRKTINRYYRIFREVIYSKQQADRCLFFGEVELDESYFGAKCRRGAPAAVHDDRLAIAAMLCAPLPRTGPGGCNPFP